MVEDVPPPETDEPVATNLEIIEKIIQKGFANSKNWKPTINDTMKAMDMWFRITQNSPFDELLNAMAAATVETQETQDAVGLPEDGGSDEPGG